MKRESKKKPTEDSHVQADNDNPMEMKGTELVDWKMYMPGPNFIKDVKLYDRALTDYEVMKDYVEREWLASLRTRDSEPANLLKPNIWRCNHCGRFYNPGPDGIEPGTNLILDYGKDFTCEECIAMIGSSNEP